MTDDQRQKVLDLVRAGHEPSEAAAMAGTSLDQLDEATTREVYASFKAVSARLKAKLMERALSGDGDAKLLASLLEQREKALESNEEATRRAIEDPRHAARCLINKLDEFGRELGFQILILGPEESAIRIRTPADSELLQRLYPDSFRRDEPLSFAGFPSLQDISQ
ncbi:hypothetical protein [Sinorhizobium fredii]|uniref:hypothetical protein n=1 Tax=Rhizobium fredii TaxID=380 RepID=UPI0004AC6B94|nr:hypothetical protein [Sinorhizobium fredii]